MWQNEGNVLYVFWAVLRILSGRPGFEANIGSEITSHDHQTPFITITHFRLFLVLSASNNPALIISCSVILLHSLELFLFPESCEMPVLYKC